MAKIASELVKISDTLHLWHFYDASVKAELFSTAVETPDGVLLVDPIPLQEESLAELVTGHPVAGIFLTNANHCRAVLQFSEKFSVPIFAHRVTATACDLSVREAKDRDSFLPNTRAVEIAGAAPGEMAIYNAEDDGSLVVGDALINFEPYGFALLPEKYCTNAKEMRRSLRGLLDYEFERMLFAHGTPLMRSARKKLEQLLQESD
jgi:glyoxylase-like metal-dependent hydrolase (beta-lactamase superfamily II)